MELIEKHKRLCLSFLNGTVSAEEFAMAYNDAFLKEPAGRMDKPLFDILENLWEDVDAYSPMWRPEEENGFRITEGTLRQEVSNALMELDQYSPAVGRSS